MEKQESSMRLDKFLKVTHLIKRRGQAKEYIDSGLAFVNGHPGKPSTKVMVGDRVLLGDPVKPRIEIEVCRIREYCPLAEIKDMYKVLGQGGFTLPMDSGDGKDER